MATSLSSVWQSITLLLADGISLIPIRDKDDENGVAKSPFGKTWKPYTEKIISKDELWYDMERFNTTAIGIICGAVSGNLEGIDIDEKYNPGISARLFDDIKTLYPDLFPLLRIHGTPSRGFHIIYRCDQPLTDGNMKLAGRPATAEELEKNPKVKNINFLETRGESGYLAAPPALNYTVVQDVPIPLLTLDDRNGLINLCRQYSTIPEKTKAPYKPTVYDSQYYETNPFEDFNNRVNPSELMSELGWSEYKHNHHFVWYTRPGKTKGVSISWNIHSRFFFCFTATTELEEKKGYTPSNLVCALEHNGDKKKTYSYLVKCGYGQIKPEIEEKIAKRSATNKKSLPPNASPTAAALHVAISQQMQQDHPFGIFWYDDQDKGIIIDRERLYAVADGLGFKITKGFEVVQILANVVYERDTREFFDKLKEYIHEDEEDLYIKICNSYESFIERHGKFTISRLQILDEDSIIQDTRSECFKFYGNGMLRIDKDGYTLQPIPKDKFIYYKSIQTRNFNEGDSGKYVDFLDKSVGLTPYVLSCIGYLAHEYKDDTAGYIIVLTEQCQNPKDGGGSGKNIFSSLFKFVTTFFSKAGSQVKYDEKFMQAWNFQKIYSIADVLKNFNFEFLKEFTTGSATMKKLHVNEYPIPVEMMPKFMISTQFSYEVKDGGLRRRIRPIEFTEFFTKAGGVDVYYEGAHFPQDWDDEDWAGFDTTMALAVQSWLATKRKLPIPKLTTSGWQKQFEHNYGRIISGIILENWAEWTAAVFVSNEEFKRNCDAYYYENNTQQKYKPSAYAFNEALDQYCIKMGYTYKKDAIDRIQNAQVRGKEFAKT